MRGIQTAATWIVVLGAIAGMGVYLHQQESAQAVTPAACVGDLVLNSNTGLCEAPQAPLAATVLSTSTDPSLAQLPESDAIPTVLEAFESVAREPDSLWLSYDQHGGNLVLQAASQILDETQGNITPRELIVRARDIVLQSYTPIDRAEALHRAEVAVNNAKAAREAQLQAMWAATAARYERARQAELQAQQRALSAAQQVEYAPQQRTAYVAPQRPAPRSTASLIGFGDDEAKRRCENMRIMGDHAGYRALCAGGGSPQPPPQNDAFTRAEDLSPRTIRDQHGNTYLQPHGSAFATDQRTGKQCFVYGDFVKCD